MTTERTSIFMSIRELSIVRTALPKGIGATAYEYNLGIREVNEIVFRAIQDHEDVMERHQDSIAELRNLLNSAVCNDASCYKCDCKSFIKSSLILMGEMGGNVYSFLSLARKSIDEVKSYVPLVTDMIIFTVNVKIYLNYIMSVSKLWKSFIDSFEFIKGYGARHTHPHSHILSYKSDYSWADEANYIFLVDDDIETFKVQKQELAPFGLSPLLKQYRRSSLVGACHGLLCWKGISKVYNKEMVVIWNPSIRKSFGIAVPKYRFYLRIGYQRVYGFGVCPGTSDPTVIKVIHADYMPWHVEVFTLSSGVWNVIQSGNLPRQSIKINSSGQVVIDRFIYWGACEKTFSDNGESTTKNMVVSFDLITKEFNVVDLPDSLKKGLYECVSVSKLRESLVVSGYESVAIEGIYWGVWVMEHNSSFTKLFTIGTSVKLRLLGFKKNGDAIFEREKERITTLDVYDPCSQQIKNLGISVELEGSFFMGSYKESLLLLDHPDLHIYSDDS
ncbi:probable galacturonosyltransferase 7 isoform X2 [Tanacetum coccineum]